MTATALPPAGGPAADDRSILLHASKVRKEFGGLVAVSDVDFDIPRGAIVGLIGPNGAGKTTFFNMITGLYRPTSGKIVFDDKVLFEGVDGKVMTSARTHEVVRAGVGRTFQNIRLFGNMSVLENVLVGLHHTLKGSWWRTILLTPGIKREEKEAVERARALLAMPELDLLKREHDYARNLPYGDQRRLEIARALATNCKLLLLDEPTAGMNPEETHELTAFVRSLRDRMGLTVLLIEHDMRVVMGISERVTVLDHGEKISEGTPDEVRSDVRVIEAYLGRGAAAEGK